MVAAQQSCWPAIFGVPLELKKSFEKTEGPALPLSPHMEQRQTAVSCAAKGSDFSSHH